MPVRLVIASNRPLPIRYDQIHAIWFKKGIHSPSEISLPFFVEVEEVKRFDGVYRYACEMIAQYKQYELQLYIENTAFHHHIQQLFPQAVQRGPIFYIKK